MFDKDKILFSLVGLIGDSNVKGTDITGAKLVTVNHGETYTLEEDSFVWFTVIAYSTVDYTYYNKIDDVELNDSFKNYNASIFAKGTTFYCPEGSGFARPTMYLFIYPLTKQVGAKVILLSSKGSTKSSLLCYRRIM